MAWCHSVTEEIGVEGEKEMEHIFSKKCIGYQSPVCKSCWYTPGPAKKSSQSFPGRKTSPRKKQKSKASQPNFLKTRFKGKVLSAKAEVCISGDICMEMIETWAMIIWRVVRLRPRMGKEGCPEVDKYFCNCIGLTWFGSYAHTSGKASSCKTYPHFPKH